MLRLPSLFPCLRVGLYAAVFAAFVSPRPVRAEGDNLQIVLRAEPDLLLADIEKVLEKALKKVPVKAGFEGKPIIDGKVIVKTITAADYNAYQRLANPDAPLVPLPSTKKDDIEVRQLPAAVPTWEFNLLGNTPQELAKLEITYDDPMSQPVSMEPTTKRDDPLSITQFGSYVLKPPADKRPVKFVAHVRTLGGKDERKVSGDWPKIDTFYLIRLNGFKGDRETLAATMQDHEKVPNALDSFDIKTDVTLAMGSAKSSEDVTEGFGFVGNKLYVSIPKLRKGKPKRAHVLFPLSKKEFEEQLLVLRKLGENNLPGHVRKSLVAGKDDAVITAESKPTWYELPLVEAGSPEGLKVGTFGRVFSLAAASDKDAKPEQYQKLLETFPQAYEIVVYEFDDGETQVALRYKRDQKNGSDVGDPKSTKTDAPQVANGGQMIDWKGKLEKLAEPKK